ncbi:MAG TPA: acetyltransferase [Candidatus Xenobia bacterium]|jgi:hypothetical protein
MIKSVSPPVRTLDLLGDISPVRTGKYVAPASVDRVTLGEAWPRQKQTVRPAAASGVHPVKVVHRLPSQLGGWTELLRDADPHFVQRDFLPQQVQKNPEIVAAFGTATPPSGDVLLHYAGDPPAGVPVHPVPVILVHGATKDGRFFWDPKEDGSNDGPAVTLHAQGYQVYAVTFAHNQDDNNVQAQQVMNAIQRVKALAGVPQVDLVGHSKGGVPVHVVGSPSFREPWMTPYQNDVRRIGLIASPNGGIDYSFRHPCGNTALNLLPFNAPMSWDRVNIGFWSVGTGEKGFGADGAYPGQGQLLDRWDKTYPLPMFEFTDGWTSYTTYHGGQSWFSHSQGIEAAMEESGQFMPRLEAAPMDPHIEVGLLAGNRANIPSILNESTGPSDGLLFVKSALLAPAGAKVVEADVLPLHHKAVVSDPAGQKWLSDFLGAPPREGMSDAALAEVERRGEETAA